METTNFLRALAIVAVIVIHVIAADSQYLQQNGLPIPDYFLNLNLFSRFSVPVFIAISGYGLAKSFTKKWSDKLKLKLLSDFYFHRTFRLLPWYFFWAIIIYLYLNFVGQGPANYGQTPFWKLLLFGKVDYHLYFVPMILKLYLIFPLLWLAIHKFPRLTLVAAFLWQIYFYRQLDATTLSDQQQYLQAGSWLFYFVFGIFLARRPVLANLQLQLFSILLLLAGFFWSLFRAYSQKALGVDPIIFTRFTQIPILLYATGVILSGLFFIPPILPRLPAYLSTSLTSLGKHSYSVYLCHTLILRLAVRNLDIFSRLPFALSVIVVLLGAYLASWLTIKLVKIPSLILDNLRQ